MIVSGEKGKIARQRSTTFTDFDCCDCAAGALQRCGLANSRPWPNWPYDPPREAYTCA